MAANPHSLQSEMLDALRDGADTVELCIVPTPATVKDLRAQMEELLRIGAALPYQGAEWKANVELQHVLHKQILAAKKLAKSATTASKSFGEAVAKLEEMGLKVRVPAVGNNAAKEQMVQTVLDDVTKGKARLDALGIEIPRGTSIVFEDFAKGTDPSDAFARAYMDEKKIAFNTNSPKWSTPENLAKIAKNNMDVGWVASDNTFVHEMGHVLHVNRLEQGSSLMWDINVDDAISPTTNRIARQVSRYAATNEKEFVAEVFSGTVAGKTYSAEVMDLYERVGGPKIGPKIKKSRTKK